MPKDGLVTLPEPGTSASRAFSFPLLDPRVEHLRVGNRIVGQFVTLGSRVQFFTTLRELAELDGAIFDGLDDLRRRIRGAEPA